MPSVNSKFVLLNSFDRSGSTLLCYVLSQHPEMETLFNPFNSSVFRQEFMSYWDQFDSSELQDEGRRLVNNVLQGDFATIKSRVFFNNSSTLSLSEDSVHVIKTTNFHLKLDWFRRNFEAIPIFALIRNPLGILCSLVRNAFHTEWYGGWAFNSLGTFIRDSNVYSNQEKSILLAAKGEVEQMAVVIGVLNAEMLKRIPSEFIIRYENLLSNTNEELYRFATFLGLSQFDFSPFVQETVNSSGKQFEGGAIYRKFFSQDEIERFVGLFNVCGNLGYNRDELG